MADGEQHNSAMSGSSSDEEGPAAAWGADLGTKYSSANVCINGISERVLIEGQEAMPSVVFIGYPREKPRQPPEVASLRDELERIRHDPPALIIVGDEALKMTGYVKNSKSLIGRQYSDPFVQEMVKNEQYKIVKGRDGEAEIEIDRRRHSPEYIEALILRHMQKAVEKHVKERMKMEKVETKECAIGIPATFGDRQRNGTVRAATMAGLDCQCLLNEPTAVAYAHVIANPSNKSMFRLVLDLGGGTFDVTLVSWDRKRNDLLVLNKAGDNDLGGEHLTTAIAKLITGRLGRDGKKLTPLDQEKVHEAAEETKRAFAKATCESHEARCQIGSRIHSLVITKEDFESAVTPILERMKEPIEKIMEENPREWEQLECVLPMGQSTVLDLVRKLFELYTGGKKLCHEVDLVTGVSSGAASWVGKYSTHHFANESLHNQPSPRDATAFDLGVKRGVSEMAVIIKRNTPVPLARAQKMDVFFDQLKDGTYSNVAEIQVFEGTSKFTYKNNYIGRVKLVRTPQQAQLRGGEESEKDRHRIELEMNIDANSIIRLKATAVWTGDVKQAEFGGSNARQEEQDGAAERAEQKLSGSHAAERPALPPTSTSSKRTHLNMLAARLVRSITTEIGDDADFDKWLNGLPLSSIEMGEEIAAQATEAKDKGDVKAARKLFIKAAYVYASLSDDICSDELIAEGKEMLDQSKLMHRREKAGMGVVIEHERIDIEEGEKGWDYERFFRSIHFRDDDERGFQSIILQDPFISTYDQMAKLSALIDTFLDCVKTFNTIYVVTTEDFRCPAGSSTPYQKDRFEQIIKSFATRKVNVEIVYRRFHDRALHTDNGFVMIMGRGIDIFTDKVRGLGLGCGTYHHFKTKECRSDLFKLADNTEYNKVYDKFIRKRAETGGSNTSQPPAKRPHSQYQPNHGELAGFGYGGTQQPTYDYAQQPGYSGSWSYPQQTYHQPGYSQGHSHRHQQSGLRRDSHGASGHQRDGTDYREGEEDYDSMDDGRMDERGQY